MNKRVSIRIEVIDLMKMVMNSIIARLVTKPRTKNGKRNKGFVNYDKDNTT